MKKRKKIFVSAYACEPQKGSESGVGWHWVMEMSKYYDLWVMTRQSNKENIEVYISENPLENKINFVYYDLPEKMRFWKKGLRGVRIYYNLWQMLSRRLVKRVMKDNDIKIYHLLTYGNALWKVGGYRISRKFIWGPVGGVDTIPAEYTVHYGFKSRMIEFVRRLVVRLLKINVGFGRRCRRADLIFCKTKNMYNAVSDKNKSKAVVFTDVAMDKVREYVPKPRGSIVKYIAVGRLDGWRGYDVLIEAFSNALCISQNISLEILGDGCDKKRLEAIIRQHGLKDKVKLCGNVERYIYEEKISDADVVVNPNLKEGAVTVAFDCMAWCKPLICVETGGYTNNFSSDCARIIEMTGREKLIKAMTDAIVEMADENIRNEFKKNIIKVRNKYAWEEKGRQIYQAIEKALS